MTTPPTPAPSTIDAMNDHTTQTGPRRTFVIATAIATILIGALYATGGGDAEAHHDDDPIECDYAEAIIGCVRTVISAPALPDGAHAYLDTHDGFHGLCADVGYDQTWCIFHPKAIDTEALVCVVWGGDLILCPPGTAPLPAPTPAPTPTTDPGPAPDTIPTPTPDSVPVPTPTDPDTPVFTG